jgi:hypothetical protein
MEIAALEPALLRDRVLLSGWFGDKVWSRDSEPERFEDYRGENFNGLYLTEFRLWRGFIHLPAPFLGVADLPDIVQTSRSPAMAAWDYAPAADPGYSRPICRRIIEGAGIARDSFASEKLGTMASGREARYTAASLRAIRSWLRQRNPGVVRGQMASLSSACRSAADAGVELAVAAITRCLPERSRLRENLWRSLLRWRRANFHRVDAVGWGMEEASKRYGISDKR